MAETTGQSGRRGAGPHAEAARAPAMWSIPEIRVIKDDLGRLRIDQSDPATYGAYAARQFLATAEADPKFRDGMTKRPSQPSIKITYVDGAGNRQLVGVREIFCRVVGDALVLAHFEGPDGEKVKDLPIAAPQPDDLDSEEEDPGRFFELALAEIGDESSPIEAEPESEPEPEPEPERPAPTPGRRLPSGPLRNYDEEAASAPTPARPELRPDPEPPPPAPVATPPAFQAAKVTTSPPAPPSGLKVRALDAGEATSLRALIEAKAGETRWANGLLSQAAERQPGDRKLQNEYIANLLRFSLDPSRAESRTPLAAALRGIIEEVLAYKGGVLDRDPLKAEKLSLQPFARTALAPAATADDGQVKTVTGSAQRTPAQILAKLEDPKLARATRVKYLLEIVPEMIETWRPDKESNRSEAGNENSPAIVRRLFSVANEQRQQRKFIDDGVTFRKVGERYAGLEGKLPKVRAPDES